MLSQLRGIIYPNNNNSTNSMNNINTIMNTNTPINSTSNNKRYYYILTALLYRNPT